MDDIKEASLPATTELLIRIDERTKNFGKDLVDIKVAMVTRKEFEDSQTSLRAGLAKAVTQEEFKPLKEYVGTLASKEELKPVRMIAFGAIGTIATTVLLIIVAIALTGSMP